MTTLLLRAIVACLPAASPPSNICQQDVLAAYQRMVQNMTNKTGKTFHLRLLTETYYKPGNQTAKERSSSTVADMYSRDECLYYRNDAVTLWQDEQYVVTVLRAQKSVFLTRVVPHKPIAAVDKFVTMRDSLIRRSTVRSCQTEVVNKASLVHSVMQLQPSPRVQGNVASLEFWLDPATKTIKQVQIKYLPTSLLTSVKLQFLKQEWESAATPVTTDARSKVLDKAGHLLPAYHGYRLVDQSQHQSRR